MVNLKDILLELFIGILWIGSGIIIIMSDYKYLIILSFIVFIYAKIQIKKRKKILPYVKEDFKKLGFEITNERPSKLSEMKYEISFFNITVGGTPIGRFSYIRQFYRIFRGKNKEGKSVLLNSIVTKKWSGENHIEIVKIKNVC